MGVPKNNGTTPIKKETNMMNFKKIRLMALTLAAATALVFTGCGFQKKDLSSASAIFQNMETVDLDGITVDSSMFAENKLTLLNLWNLGCTACIMEMPVLDQLNKDLAEQGIAIKGLYYNFGEELSSADRTEIQKVLEDANADFQQILTSKAMDESDELKNLTAFPNTYFIDSEGNVVDSVAGSDDYDGWIKTIEKVLKKVDAK